MKLVYIASPYRASEKRTVEQNVDLAQRLCRAVVNRGAANSGKIIPFAPHLFFTRFLNDKIEHERRLAIDMAKEFIQICDELWAFDYQGISEGMKEEIARAKKLGKPVFFRPPCWRDIWS